VHDPEVKKNALAELEHRQMRVKENDALIKANEADLAKAEARVAERQRKFEATRQGGDEGAQRRAFRRERGQARIELESAQDHLKAVQDRTAAASKANRNHYERMQELDRVLHPEQYPELSGAKGNFGEQQQHSLMEREGYEFRGSSKEPTHGPSRDQGLDGVYEKSAAATKGPQHVVGEAKYGQAKLRPGQEKWEWVDERLDASVGRDHANRMRREGYEYWVTKYDPKTRQMLPKKLWEFRPNTKLGPGGRPLGTVHYFPPS
jgi:multidrug efflux pump subunit AcrA (membrane-fusion protein)